MFDSDAKLTINSVKRIQNEWL